MRTLVLLHGLGTGPSGWQPQLEAFPNAVAPRLEVAEETLDRTEAPFDLCGLSLGALVALRYAGEHPDRVRRLVVCAGIAGLPWYFRGLQTASRASSASCLPRAFGKVSSPDCRKSIGRRRSRRSRTWTRARASRTLRTAATFRLERLPGMPTLVLCGERDRVNVKLSRRLAETLPDARFEIVPAAGHVANLDNPEAFTRLLREFSQLDSPPWP